MRAAGDNTSDLFPGAVSEWTADQRSLVSITQEYWNAFRTLNTKNHETPPDYILGELVEFRKWWDEYQDDPESAENPYKKYQHGFGKKRKR